MGSTRVASRPVGFMEGDAVKPERAFPKGISDADKALLQRIRSAQQRGDAEPPTSRHITRERSCEGKRAFRTPQYAEKVAAYASARAHIKLRYYLCPFCLCYHLTKSHP